MAEYAWNPATGSGEAVQPSMSIPTVQQSDVGIEEASHQERQDFWSDHTQAETAKNLTQRRVGTAGDVQSTDMALFAKQAELASARDAGDHLRAEQLEREVLSMAQTVVEAGTVEDINADRENPEIGDIHAARAELRDNPEIQNGMATVEHLVESEVLPESVLEVVQAGLSAESTELLETTTDIVRDIHKSPEAFRRATSYEEIVALNSEQMSFFQENYGDDIANNVAALNYGIRQGKCDFNEAFKIAAKNGLLQPMLAASRANIGFSIASW